MRLSLLRCRRDSSCWILPAISGEIGNCRFARTLGGFVDLSPRSLWVQLGQACIKGQ